MNTQQTQALLALVVLIIGLLVGSDTIAATFFTKFDIYPTTMQPEQNTIVTVMNTGLLQANNVIVQIIANGTISDYTDMCIEGDIQSIINNYTLAVEFSRMSPHVECNIELTVPEPVSLQIEVSSDGRIAPLTAWSPGFAVLMFIVLLMFMVVASVIFSIFTARFIGNTEIYNRIVLWWFKKAFKKAENAKEIIEYVRKEYGWKITEADAKILELIHSRKTTIAQLQKHSGIPLDQVKYCVEKMRRLELVLKEETKLDRTLDNFFKHPQRIDGRLAEQLDGSVAPDDVDTCNKHGCDNARLPQTRACMDHVCGFCQVGWKSWWGACRPCSIKAALAITGVSIAIYITLVLAN